MKISRLQVVEQKDWAGLTTENHLGALYQQQPILVSNVIDTLFKVNLGGEDIVSYINKFPVMTIDDDVPYQWMIQGNDERNIALTDYFNSDMTNKPAKPGIGRSTFIMVFPEKMLSATDVIVGRKLNTYSLRVMRDPFTLGSGWGHEVQLITGDDSLFIPASELAVGSKWSKLYSQVEQSFSSRGGSVYHTSPYRMQNELSMIRKEYEVPGNMIHKGENKPLAFSWQSNGKTFTNWLGKLDWDFSTQFRKEKANLMLYGKSNRMADGTYGNTGESGYEMRSGFGLYEQIAPSNIFYYNNFDLDWLILVMLSLTVGKIDQDEREIVMSTGEYGAYQFHKAVTADSSKYTPNFSSDRIYSTGAGKMGYRGQFVEYQAVQGIVFKIFIDPLKDNTTLNTVMHPDGGPASSYIYDILDFGTASGEPNIQRVVLKHEEQDIYRYISGLRSPFDPYNRPSPTQTSSPVDGYKVLKGWIGGIRVKNPMRCARIMPRILL